MQTPERIYKRVEAILATKGPRSESAYPGQKFRHDFTTRPEDWALPDDTVVVTHGGAYRVADGSALLTSRLTRVTNPRLHQRIGKDKDIWHVNPPRRRGKNPLLTVIGAGNPPTPHPRRSSMLALLNAENLKKVGAAGVGAVASSTLPAMIWGPDVSTTKAYATQAGIALAGYWAVKKFVGAGFAVPFFLGAGVGAFQDPIRRALGAAYGAVRGGGTAMGMYPGLSASYYSGGDKFLSSYGRPGNVGSTPGIGMGSLANPGIGAYRWAYAR